MSNDEVGQFRQFRPTALALSLELDIYRTSSILHKPTRNSLQESTINPHIFIDSASSSDRTLDDVQTRTVKTWLQHDDPFVNLCKKERTPQVDKMTFLGQCIQLSKEDMRLGLTSYYSANMAGTAEYVMLYDCTKITSHVLFSRI
ncbi:hypothetical protein FRC18_010053 [Serendipita sp. 400]|nr:hypothetical protein FRC18_010053 [Serendipita sp. 400]